MIGWIRERYARVCGCRSNPCAASPGGSLKPATRPLLPLTFSITATAGAREARQIAEQVQGIGQGPIRRTHAAGAQGRLDFMRAESDPGGAMRGRG